MESRKPKRLYKVVAKLGFELVTIIVGISIALFVNNLQERKRDRKVLTATLHGLSQEFSKNVENINKIQPTLERFRDTLQFYEKDMNLSLYDLATKSPGLNTADLYTTNWQATLSSNSLRLLDFETITLLSQIDAKHQELKDQEAILVSIVYSPAMYRSEKEGLEYRNLLNEWIGGYLGNEQELIELYNRFNECIGKMSKGIDIP